ncbi:MAG: energy transducer TonB [Chitinophagales bacterium]
MYGEDAKKGVVIFEGAQVIDTPPATFYKEPLSAMKTAQDDNKIFEKVEVDPSFPGGEAAWGKYLQRNLDASIPVKNGAPNGAYTVVVQFIVDTAGYLHDIKALTKHGYGMEEEAIKMIKFGPPWIPALQNGHKVTAYKNQQITFVISDGDDSTAAIIKLGEIVYTAYTLSANKTDMLASKTIEPLSAVEIGFSEWKKYLERWVNPFIPISEGWHEGTYTLLIQFARNSDGTLSNIKCLNSDLKDSKTAKYCINVFKHISKALPDQEGKNPKERYYIQPLTFVISK